MVRRANGEPLSLESAHVAVREDVSV